MLPKAPVPHRQGPSADAHRRLNAPLRLRWPNAGVSHPNREPQWTGRASFAERSLAHARAHPAGRGRAPDRLGRRLSLSGRHRATGWSTAQGRPLGTDFSNVYAAGTYVLDGNPDAPFDPAAAARPRAANLRHGDAVLRLALSAVLSVRRRRAGENALWRCAHGLAGGHARALSAGDPGDLLVFRGARSGSESRGLSGRRSVPTRSDARDDCGSSSRSPSRRC